MQTRFAFFGFAVALLGCLVQPAQAQWDRINVKFYWNAGGSAFTSPAQGAIGGPTDVWNICRPQDNNETFSSIVDYQNASAPAITIDVLNSSSEQWGDGNWNVPVYGSMSASSYYTLLRYYIWNPDVRIKGLTPNAPYDLYILFRNNNETALDVNGDRRSSDRNNYTGDPLQTERDYLLYKGMLADATGQIRYYRYGGDNFGNSAFQIRPAAANTVPTAANNTLTKGMNIAHTFAVSEFGFSDTDIGDVLQQLQVTSLPGAGTLTLSGTEVIAGQLISRADIHADNLVYTPVDYATGAPYTTFNFKVHDGLALSAAANTITINVAAPADLINVELDWIGRDRVDYITSVEPGHL
jgi:hypothetical protein